MERWAGLIIPEYSKCGAEPQGTEKHAKHPTKDELMLHQSYAFCPAGGGELRDRGDTGASL
ncbi:hypothetical protein IFM47457_01130 [Aspergillus lentulus]|nr:hypothetical protein IFM47457_01130 [Aspergillus lentulus]